MNQLEVDNINESIGYEKGKIYFIPNKNYSSKLWESLYEQGYKMTTYKSGLVDIKDDSGCIIVNSAIGRVNALFELSKAMR